MSKDENTESYMKTETKTSFLVKFYGAQNKMRWHFVDLELVWWTCEKLIGSVFDLFEISLKILIRRRSNLPSGV